MDVALRWSETHGAADLAIEDDDVAGDAGLDTALILSLFMDARALPGDTLPGAPDDKRGYWADGLSEIEGDRMGSRLWLLERAKLEDTLPKRARSLALEGLSWLDEDAVASDFDVIASVSGERLDLEVTIQRPSADVVSFRYAHVWDAEELERAL